MLPHKAENGIESALNQINIGIDRFSLNLLFGPDQISFHLYCKVFHILLYIYNIYIYIYMPDFKKIFRFLFQRAFDPDGALSTIYRSQRKVSSAHYWTTQLCVINDALRLLVGYYEHI